MIAFIDLETTGTEPFKNEVIAWGAVLTDDDLNIIDKFEFKIRPTCEYTWDEAAAEVHGISWEHAQTFPTFSEIKTTVIQKFDKKTKFVCHAMPFYSRIDLIDYRFLHALFWNHDLRCEFESIFPESLVDSTIYRRRKWAQDMFGVENQKLNTYMKKFGRKFRHHDASDDALACYYVYKYQQEILDKGELYARFVQGNGSN